MNTNRHNFTKKTIEILAKRVGSLCSNPSCQKQTIGPHSEEMQFTVVGIAAHITAAAPGGPRYDEEIAEEQRRSINNGIWLCPSCATLIDKDPETYTTDLLKNWKIKAESFMRHQISGQGLPDEIPHLEGDLIWVYRQRWNKGYSVNNPSVIRVGIDKAIAHWELVWNFNIAIYNNSKHHAYNLFIEEISIPDFKIINDFSTINNLGSLQKLDINANYTSYYEGTYVEADTILKPYVPKRLDGLKLKISYQDEQRQTHNVTLLFSKNKIINK